MLIRVQSVGGEYGHDSFFVRSLIDGLVVGSLPVFTSWRLPMLYASGVRYAVDPEHGTGTDEIDPPPIVLQRGWGDCGNLTLWRLLELNQNRWVPVLRRVGNRNELVGIKWAKTPARAVVQWVNGELHALVRHPDGQTEDPSEILGMPVPT